MDFDFNRQTAQPSLYAVSPESIQPQFISPESIQPQFISPGSIQPQYISPESIQPQFISPGSILPQPLPPYAPYPQPYPPYPYPPYPVPPYPPTQTGGCNQKWAIVRLRDGRTLNIYITSISEYSIGGFLPNGRQIALDLNEIVELTC